MVILPNKVIERDSALDDSNDSALVRFLEKDLDISQDSIKLALRYCRQEQGTLPMVLWQYGFVSIEQLNQIFDWLAH